MRQTLNAVALPAETEDLRAQVRDFLAAELGLRGVRPRTATTRSGASTARSVDGWPIGAGWGWPCPASIGGGERGLDRFVVVEELLRWGAPVGFHWIADRQSGPTQLGSAPRSSAELPAGDRRGELSFAIGMSEPDSGSDLSSVRTAATARGGWPVNGRRCGPAAHRSPTGSSCSAPGPAGGRQQAGLTQFLVDRRATGLTVRPIAFIDGERTSARWCSTTCSSRTTWCSGTIGNGWPQRTAELAFERGGPDRLLSPFGVLRAWLASGVGAADPVAREWLGAAVARLWVRGRSRCRWPGWPTPAGRRSPRPPW